MLPKPFSPRSPISIHVPRVEDAPPKSVTAQSRSCISIHVPRVEDDSNTALIVCSITLHKQAVLPIFSLSPHFLIGYITSPLLFFLRECTGIFMCASRSRSQIISGSVTSNDGFIPICFILFSYEFPRLYIRRLSRSLSISDSSFASTSLSFAASSWHSNTEFCTR